VLKEKSADGDDAEQRMQFAPEEAVALSGAQRLNAWVKLGRGRMLSGCHADRGS
jgi:hypothetical protein